MLFIPIIDFKQGSNYPRWINYKQPFVPLLPKPVLLFFSLHVTAWLFCPGMFSSTSVCGAALGYSEFHCQTLLETT